MADGQQTTPSNSRPYWRPLGPGETVHFLVDLVHEPHASQDASAAIHEQAVKNISETTMRFSCDQLPEIAERIISEAAQRIVRDMAPGIIEKLIREEIEKLKRESN
ncbi:MAG: hypothetical protein C0394_00900 [Syntrophus sp. (in: bacteria)]|nr:hypothetical protein [Syntrophus sp. (in: bacteria)]